ncbi:unnamed protein product [Protopolystoma xenopodis]|uniref:Uncharacterized protein n=1 Tax=Protopolystoma xenopodis TaxID=117903 RepID=A0A3S5CG42_9PLAT|nr:unnamed protein product [Protopolystoma xenopodis]
MAGSDPSGEASAVSILMAPGCQAGRSQLSQTLQQANEALYSQPVYESSYASAANTVASVSTSLEQHYADVSEPYLKDGSAGLLNQRMVQSGYPANGLIPLRLDETLAQFATGLTPIGAATSLPTNWSSCLSPLQQQQHPHHQHQQQPQHPQHQTPTGPPPPLPPPPPLLFNSHNLDLVRLQQEQLNGLATMASLSGFLSAQRHNEALLLRLPRVLTTPLQPPHPVTPTTSAADNPNHLTNLLAGHSFSRPREPQFTGDFELAKGAASTLARLAGPLGSVPHLLDTKVPLFEAKKAIRRRPSVENFSKSKSRTDINHTHKQIY